MNPDYPRSAVTNGKVSRVAWGVAFLLGVAMLGAARADAAEEATIEVAADRPDHAISPMLYGLMTEEINHAYDGGLYAELVRNRDFKEADKDHPTKPAHWICADGTATTVSLDRQNPVNTTGLPVSLKVEATLIPKNGLFVVANDGYWGIPLRPSTKYFASFYAQRKGFQRPAHD